MKRKYLKKISFQVTNVNGLWAVKTSGRNILCANIKDAVQVGFRTHTD